MLASSSRSLPSEHTLNSYGRPRRWPHTCELFLMRVCVPASLGGLCRFTQDHPLLVKYINLFLQSVFPDSTWTSICVSHNEFAHLHSDFQCKRFSQTIHVVSVLLRRVAYGSQLLRILCHIWKGCRLRIPRQMIRFEAFCCVRVAKASLSMARGHTAQSPGRVIVGLSQHITSSQLGSVSEQEFRQLRELAFPLPAAASEALPISQGDSNIEALS